MRKASGRGIVLIERLLGFLVGGVVTFLLLWLFDDGRIISDEKMGWLVAIVIGILANVFHPLIWGIYRRRRTHERQDRLVRSEVERQLESERVVEADRTTPPA
jgi:hypothetical protein